MCKSVINQSKEITFVFSGITSGFLLLRSGSAGGSAGRLADVSMGKSLMLLILPSMCLSPACTENSPLLKNITSVPFSSAQTPRIACRMQSTLNSQQGILQRGQIHFGLAEADVIIMQLCRSKHWQWLQNSPRAGVLMRSVESVQRRGILTTSQLRSSDPLKPTSRMLFDSSKVVRAVAEISFTRGSIFLSSTMKKPMRWFSTSILSSLFSLEGSFSWMTTLFSLRRRCLSSAVKGSSLRYLRLDWRCSGWNSLTEALLRTMLVQSGNCTKYWVASLRRMLRTCRRCFMERSSSERQIVNSCFFLLFFSTPRKSTFCTARLGSIRLRWHMLQYRVPSFFRMHSRWQQYLQWTHWKDPSWLPTTFSHRHTPRSIRLFTQSVSGFSGCVRLFSCLLLFDLELPVWVRGAFGKSFGLLFTTTSLIFLSSLLLTTTSLPFLSSLASLPTPFLLSFVSLSLALNFQLKSLSKSCFMSWGSP